MLQSSTRPTPRTLDYATPVPRRSLPARLLTHCLHFLNRHRLVLSCLLIWLLTMAALVISLCYPWAWYGSRDAFLRHRMRTFTMSPDRIVYEEDALLAANLIAEPADPATAYIGPEDAVIYGEHPNPFKDYIGIQHARYMPQLYVWACGRPFGPPGGLVFVHERTGPNGNRRTVLVTLAEADQFDPLGKGIHLFIRSIPTNENYSFNRRGTYRVKRIHISIAPTQTARLYAGQLDPHNDARLTIKYEIDNIPGTIEGLLDAQDSVSLAVLDGPAKTTWQKLPK